MAPIIVVPLNPRQNDPTASPPQITLTVTRLSTTYTTTIGLGAATSPPVNQDSVPTSSPETSPSPPAQPVIAPTNKHSNGAAVGGGIVGAVLGLFVVVLLLWWCGVCGSRSRSSSSGSRSLNGSRPRSRSRSWSRSPSRSSSRSSSDRSSDYSATMGQRGGGWSKREKEYVRRPKTARTRSHMDRNDIIGFDLRRGRTRNSRSGNTVTIKGWSRPKRRGRTPKGLAGWYLGTRRSTRRDSRRRNSSRWSDSDWRAGGEKSRNNHAWVNGRAHISTIDD
ncbi:hypothetical protein BJ875DRAFT_279679 [Amylocarpus encephaloides]|uniref:Uncharacterized protein n=1 Tax=Amylocarpus encephaloides TaxID=45428 RepID=A0A9P7YLI9_9HELO|nr:hypothetical protein BJ875DRAFT_279679 [Amylocarpus encephaloides]